MSAESPNALVVNSAALPIYAVGESRRLSLDSSGRLIVSTFGAGAFVVAGATTPADAFPNPTNAVTTFSLGGVFDVTRNEWNRMVGVTPGDAMVLPFPPQTTLSVGAVYNGVNYVRARGDIPGDAVGNPAVAIPDQFAMNALWDPAGSQWQRARSAPLTNVSDIAIGAQGQQVAAVAYAANGTFGDNRRLSGTPFATAIGSAFGLYVNAAGYNYDPGSGNWVTDRAAAPADGIAAPAFAKQTLATLMAFNGSTYDRLRVDATKRLKITQEDPDIAGTDGDPTVYLAAGATQTANVVAAAAKLLGFYVINPDIDGFLVFVNKASAAVNGDTAVFSFGMDVSDTEPLSKILHLGREFFGPQGKKFTTGLTWAWSSTATTVTLATPAAGMTINVLYRS